MKLCIILLVFFVTGGFSQFDINSPGARLETVLGCLEWDMTEDNRTSTLCYYEDENKPCYGVNVAQRCTDQLNGISHIYPPSQFDLKRENIFYLTDEKLVCIKPSVKSVTGYLHYILGFHADCEIVHDTNDNTTSSISFSFGCVFPYSVNYHEELESLLCCHQIHEEAQVSAKASIVIEAHSLPQEAPKGRESVTTIVHSLPNPIYKNKHVGFAAPTTIAHIQERLRLEVISEHPVEPKSWSNAVRDLLIIVVSIFLAVLLFVFTSVFLCQKYPAMPRVINRCCPVFNDGMSSHLRSETGSSSSTSDDSEQRDKMNDSVVSFAVGDTNVVF